MVLALLTVPGLTALAAGPSVGGAPLCPKGGKNLIDLGKITGDTGDYLYTKDQLISEGGNEDKTVEFAVDASGLTDLAPYVGASLEVMERDTQRMRPQRPWTFSNLKKGEGLQAVIDFIVERGMLGVRG